MKALTSISGLALLMCGCATTEGEMPAQPMGSPPPAATAPMASAAARSFATMSASGNLFEIESSRLALERSNNQMVRQFAQMMIDDHSRMMSAMAPLAASLGLPQTPPMAPHHAEMLNHLRGAGSGGAFDAAYHHAQLMAHQESLTLHRSYASNGDHPQLRNLAAQAVPVIEQHLNHLQMHRNHMMQPGGTRAGERG